MLFIFFAFQYGFSMPSASAFLQTFGSVIKIFSNAWVASK
ncbi:hypothetical protein MSP8886_01182 [Marinomonas spartinae]|uniref:Uncharacterized protein n=1 Tax=Marinomonas spartinae TaxID=1792290 RepID=A0A1A8T7D6_9GAMM|nr:hypothetical protein MSP8886_01182 [Marinomonas spartinae]